MTSAFCLFFCLLPYGFWVGFFSASLPLQSQAVTLLIDFYAFAIGAIIGSFLNVVIYRLPREESIVSPRSRCPHCATPIRAWDNLPILSWLILRGRCRSCHGPISGRYPLVELANGLFWLAAWTQTGNVLDALLIGIIASMTIALIYIDADIQILPDVIDLPGVLVGLAIGWRAAGLHYPHLTLASSLTDSVLGAALGAGLLYAVALSYKLVRKIEGMGLGDVKMMAMIGAVCGWSAILPVLFIASVAGAIIGIAIGLRRSEGLQFALPFGVFLGIAFLTVIFFGQDISMWYFGLAGM